MCILHIWLILTARSNTSFPSLRRRTRYLRDRNRFQVTSDFVLHIRRVHVTLMNTHLGGVMKPWLDQTLLRVVFALMLRLEIWIEGNLVAFFSLGLTWKCGRRLLLVLFLDEDPVAVAWKVRMTVFDGRGSQFWLDWRLDLSRDGLTLWKNPAYDGVPWTFLLISFLCGILYLWLKLHQTAYRALPCEILRILLADLHFGALGRRTLGLCESDLLLNRRRNCLLAILSGLLRDGSLFDFNVSFFYDLVRFLLHHKNLLLLQTLSRLNILTLRRNDHFLWTHHLSYWSIIGNEDSWRLSVLMAGLRGSIQVFRARVSGTVKRGKFLEHLLWFKLRRLLLLWRSSAQ